jgi:hypothetical protein
MNPSYDVVIVNNRYIPLQETSQSAGQLREVERALREESPGSSGTPPGNTWAPEFSGDGKCHRKKTAGQTSWPVRVKR